MCSMANLSQDWGFEVEASVVMDRARLEADREGGWRRLWEAFAAGKGKGEGEGTGAGGTTSSSSALVLHLPAHYALVFGLREYVAVEGGGAPVREVLSARRKQKPKEWIDFDRDVVGWMEGPDGDRCQFILVRRRGAAGQG